ncbi:TetR family transcriptional regulator [Rhodococcus koreensis]
MGLATLPCRARLLHAAVIAFAEKGFHGTTMRAVASAAGPSPTALLTRSAG